MSFSHLLHVSTGVSINFLFCLFEHTFSFSSVVWLKSLDRAFRIYVLDYCCDNFLSLSQFQMIWVFPRVCCTFEHYLCSLASLWLRCLSLCLQMAQCPSTASPSRLTLLISLECHLEERVRPWVWDVRSSFTLRCTATSQRSSGTETVRTPKPWLLCCFGLDISAVNFTDICCFPRCSAVSF